MLYDILWQTYSILGYTIKQQIPTIIPLWKRTVIRIQIQINKFIVFISQEMTHNTLCHLVKDLLFYLKQGQAFYRFYA